MAAITKASRHGTVICMTSACGASPARGAGDPWILAVPPTHGGASQVDKWTRGNDAVRQPSRPEELYEEAASLGTVLALGLWQRVAGERHPSCTLYAFCSIARTAADFSGQTLSDPSRGAPHVHTNTSNSGHPPTHTPRHTLGAVTHFLSRVVGARLLVEGEAPEGVEAGDILAAQESWKSVISLLKDLSLRPPSSTALVVTLSAGSHPTLKLLGETQRSPGGDGKDRIHGLQDSLTSHDARKSLVSEVGTNNATREGLKPKGGMVWQKPRVGGAAASLVHAGRDKADDHTRARRNQGWWPWLPQITTTTTTTELPPLNPLEFVKRRRQRLKLSDSVSSKRRRMDSKTKPHSFTGSNSSYSAFLNNYTLPSPHPCVGVTHTSQAQVALVLAVDLVLAVQEVLVAQPSLTRSHSFKSLKSPAGPIEATRVEESPVASPSTQTIQELVCGASQVASLSGSLAAAESGVEIPTARRLTCSTALSDLLHHHHHHVTDYEPAMTASD
ncbi:hypothetical protein O3P69_008473 [Scylla paramamosain]|uniref:Uncharacterized protein n=1 Tax=Scylla paramamosain TaxID=85552 RepID=A0AAW0SNQ1_SCYPA